MRDRSLDELEVSQRRELDREVLERLVRLVDDEDVEEDVELVDVDVGLGVDGVGEAGELNNAVKLGDEVVLGRLDRASRLRKIELVLRQPLFSTDTSRGREERTSSASPDAFFFEN